MASTRTKTTFRIVVAVLVIVAFFYIYGNTSAAVLEIRQNKQTVTQGLSRFVYRAQRSVRWYSDSTATRRILLQVL